MNPFYLQLKLFCRANGICGCEINYVEMSGCMTTGI